MTKSLFSQIELAPPDPILGLTEAYNKDTNPSKVNLGVGIYQDDSGSVPVLETIRKAEAKWLEIEKSKGYLPIDGVPEYRKAVQELLLGKNSEIIKNGIAVTVQSLGGTGALKIGADFLKTFFPDSTVYISDPTWANHRQIFEKSGFTVDTYTYYDPSTHGLDFEGMYKSIDSLADGSIVLLHACCHNPTGVDPTHEQWNKIAEIFKNRNLIPFIDFAYQGFGEGLDEDAYSVRLFADQGIPCLVSSSFSKSMSVYRERVGALTFITENPEESTKILSQIKRIIRSNYSNPSSHGAQAATLILTDPELRAEWEKEVAIMRERIQRMRHLFVEGLKSQGVDQDFGFIIDQKGMFSFSGLSKEAVEKLKKEKSLYIVGSGRICVAAMNQKNIPYITEAIASALK